MYPNVLKCSVLMVLPADSFTELLKAANVSVNIKSKSIE